MKEYNRIILIFLIFITLILTTSVVTANTDVNDTQNTFSINNLQINNLQAVSPTNPSVTFYGYDTYNESSDTYTEEGILVSDVNFQIYDADNNLILNGTSDRYGTFSTNNLNYGKYSLKAQYLTYKTVEQNFTVDSLINDVEVRFIPDICLLMSYSSHSEKINVLTNISRRVYYIDTYPYELEKEWLLEYAEYIQLDMFAEGSYKFGTDILTDSPANKNHMIAYTFGVYNSTFLDTLNINFIGASNENNTPDTVENTYIGSYFQAFDINNLDVLYTNMENLYQYILYLLGDIKVNPTLDSSKTPLVDASLGFYHPDLGKVCFQPDQTLVNTWILQDPGYNKDGVGSLNWMYVEYKQWQESNSNPLDLFKQYDSWYSTNKSNLNNSYVAIVSYYPGGNLIDAMIRKYEAENRSVFNIFQSVTSPSIASVLTIVNNNTDRGIAVINSLYDWSLDYENSGNGGAIDEYVQIGVDVIKTIYGVSKTSYQSEYGPQAEWTYSVSIPSFEGVYGAILCSYNNEYGEEIVIEGGVNQLVENSLGWINLREKENADKKIAVILWDYPPGKGHIGASYLDIFSSIHDLLVELDKNGYNIGMDVNSIPNTTELYTIISESANKGPYAQGLLNQYVEKYYDRLVENNQLVDYEEYLTYLHMLNETLQDDLIEYWGEGLGISMVYNGTYLVIPGVMFGNVLITFQPSRGWDSVEEYHSAYLPPPQHYVAFYKWLKHNYHADALINLGTHGTLEFLPGRPIGLQEDDWPLALTNIPTIYPYIVSNPGEAMTARERIAALLITHMTPATVLSELYGNLTTLKTYISNYETAMKANSTDLAASYEILILNLSRELAYAQPTINQSFEDWLEELDEELEDLSNDIVTIGLHTIGVGLTDYKLVQELITIAASRTSIYDYILWMLYPELKDTVGYYDVLHNRNYTQEVDNAQLLLENIITDLINTTYTFEEVLAKYNINSSNLDLIECLLFVNETISELVNNTEWDSIIAALNGRYVLPNLMADPSYSDSLPTGRDPYAYDTTKMPSKAAWETAKLIDDGIIVDYYEKHGEFPELVGLIMWGTELLRTEGIGMAQFLYFLGVSPTWSQTETITGIRLMPLNSLTVTLSNGTVIQRPRIDVYASIVTQNADWISMLVNAVQLVYSGTPSEGTDVNMVKKHYEENPSLDRLFGLQGAVLEGTGMADYIPNTDRWQNDTNMAATLTGIYLSRVSYAWSVDNKGQISVNKKTSDYEYLLKNVDVITQNIDSTWRFLDSDDYYDWFGGMLGASQYLGGRPETAVADIRNKHDINIRTLDGELEFEIRSTVINPKVRDSLLGDNPSGWQTYASKYDFIFGFTTVAHKTADNGVDLENLISDNIFNALGENALYMGEIANADYKAVSFQTSAAWMIYSYDKGYWKADSKTVTKLVDAYVQSVVQYGFACCHHTCANLEFNKMLMQLSSLDPNVKQQFADIYQQATLKEIYTNDSSNNEPQENPTQNPDTNQGESSSSSSMQSEDSANDPSSGSNSGGSSSNVGDQQSSDSDDTSGADSGSDSSTGEDKGDTYEVSPSQSNPQSEGSMPAIIIGCIVGVLLIFGFGYTRSSFGQGKSKSDIEDLDDEDY